MHYVDQMPARIVGLPLSLVIVSAIAGVVMMLLFKLTSNPDAIRRAKRRMQAQLLALRLFGDEPVLVWRAQGRLLTANLRYMGVMLVPIAAAAIPFLLVYPHLEALYGRATLPVGSATVLTLRMQHPLSQPLLEPHLEMPPGLQVETPGVRIPDAGKGAGEISWLLRAVGPVSEPVRIHVGDMEVTKTVQVGSGHGYVDETRPAGMLRWLQDPGEAPIGSAGIEAVHVMYGSQRLSALSFEWPWEAWLIVISMVTALLVKNRLGVVF
jgi:hypothetical protein